MVYLEVHIFTPENRLLCKVVAERTWRPVDVKEGVHSLTGIGVVEQRLFGPGGQELPEKDFLGKHWAEAQEVVGVTLQRRPLLQAEWLEKVQEHGLQLRHAPPDAREDPVVAMAAVQKNWRAIEFVSEELKLDRDIALAAALQNHKALAHIPRRLWDDRLFVLEMIKKDWSYIKSASDDVCNDFEVMSEAVQRNWRALQFASEDLRGNRELVVAALQKGGMEVLDREFATPAAAEQIYRDAEAVDLLVRLDWRNLELADKSFRSKREPAMVAVQQDWRALGVVSEDLRSDPDVILAAVQQDWCSLTVALKEFPVQPQIIRAMAARSWHILAYLPDEYLADESIAAAAVQQNWKALQYVAKECRANPRVVIEAIRQYPKVLEMDMVAEEPHGDKECILAAVLQQGALLKEATEELRGDPEVVLAAVQQDWRALEFGTEEVRSAYDVVVAAAEQDIGALAFASGSLRADDATMLKLIRLREGAVRFAAPELLESDEFVSELTRAQASRDFYLDMVRNNWRCLSLMPQKLTRDREIVAEACRQDWQALDLATTLNENLDDEYDTDPPDFFADSKVMLAAVEGNWELMKRVDIDIWQEKAVVLAAVKQEHTVLDIVPRRHKKFVWSQPEIVRAAIQQEPLNVNLMDKTLWGDVPLVLEAVKQNWQILLKAPVAAKKKLWQERDICLSALQQDWQAIRHIHIDMWDDWKLIMVAVKQSWKALDLAPSTVQRAIWAVREITVEAVSQAASAIRRTERTHQEDREIFFMAIKKDPNAITYLHKDSAKRWWKDPEAATFLVSHNIQNFHRVDRSLMSNPEVIMAAVRIDGSLLKHADESMRADKEVVMAAVQKDGLALAFASKELRDDRQVCAALDGDTSGGEDGAGRGTPGATGATEVGQRRRGRQAEVQEVIDELAQEVKRTTLLDRVEQQMKGVPHVSRIFFGFGVTDDRRVQASLEQEFKEWRDQQEKLSTASLTGLLLFVGQSAVHFLEGPTEMLFEALGFFQSLSTEAKPAAGGSPRPALINPVRVLHFTELHGQRMSSTWCTFASGGKHQGGPVAIEDGNAADTCFVAYRKIVLMCAKVKDSIGHSEDAARAAMSYKRHSDLIPTVDEVGVLLGKAAGDHFFSYQEFEKLFIAPFHLVLHSELLWPLPPALSY